MIALVIVALPLALATNVAAERLPVFTFTTAEGLPHDRVKAIREDHLGFIRLCTTEGLSRFDGREFVNFGVGEGLSVPSANDFLETNEGAWVATNGGGVAFFDPSAPSPRFRVVGTGEDARSRVNVLLRDRLGALWAGTDGGLVRLASGAGWRDGARFENVALDIPEHPDASVAVWALTEVDGGILVGTHFGLVMLGADGSRRHIALDPHVTDVVFALDRAEGGDLLVGHGGGGLFILDPASLAVRRRFTPRDGLPSGRVRAVHASADRVLLGTDKGLAVLANGRVTAFGEREGLSSSPITSISEDREGGIWLATPDSGAMRLLLSGDTIFNEMDGLGPIVSGVFAGPNGMPCALSSGWTVSCFDGRRFTSVRPPHAAALGATAWRAFHGVILDHQRELWFATGEGLYRYARSRRLADLATATPLAVYTTRDGTLARYSQGHFLILSGRSGFPSASVAGFAFDPAGRLWMCVDGHGVVHVDRPEAAAPVAAASRAVNGAVDFYLRGLVSDPAGRLYFGTGRELMRFDPGTDTTTTVKLARGLVDTELIAGYRDREGSLWFGTMHGLVRLARHPDRETPVARVRIGAVTVSGSARQVPACGAESLDLGTLPPSVNLSFEFFGVGLLTQPLRYEHIMEGLERRWSAPHSERAVQVAHFAPGRYRFHVRAASGGGALHQEAVVSFTVAPPLWRRWWFLTGVTFLAAGLGLAAHAARVRRKQELEAVRARIASDLHDDLGATLSRISILSEVIGRRLHEGNPADELVAKIGEASRTVGEKLADGIWAVDPRRDDLASLGERLHLTAAELLEPAGISWRVELPENAARVHLHPDRRRNIYLLLKEAMSNAARHSGARHAVLRVAHARGTLLFELADDGRGFDTEAAAAAERLAGGGVDAGGAAFSVLAVAGLQLPGSRRRARGQRQHHPQLRSLDLREAPRAQPLRGRRQGATCWLDLRQRTWTVESGRWTVHPPTQVTGPAGTCGAGNLERAGRVHDGNDPGARFSNDRPAEVTMPRLTVTCATLLLAARAFAGEAPAPAGPYLGQTPPGRQARLFAPGVVNTGMFTRDLAVSPDGREIYFSIVVGLNKLSTIAVTRLVDGRWTAPEVVPQLGLPGSSSIEPCISPDGRRLYFSSNRPAPGKKEDSHDFDIWVMDREGEGWGQPVNLGEPINSRKGEYFPSLTRDGTLYFTAPCPQGGAECIWRSRPHEGHFQRPEKLPPEVNAGTDRFNAFVAPDESYVIVPTYGMPDSRGGVDYYVTFHNVDGSWTPPVNLGDAVNSRDENEYSASVSPDGKYLFFMSARMPAIADMPAPLTLAFLRRLRDTAPNGKPAVYWIDASVITDIRASTSRRQ